MCSALAGVILTHVPWNHFSHMSQQIQNRSWPWLWKHAPHTALSWSSCWSSPSLSSSSFGGGIFEPFEFGSDWREGCALKCLVSKENHSWFQNTMPQSNRKVHTLEPDLLLLLLLLGVFSLDSLFTVPVITSYMVGRLLIILKSRLLQGNHQKVTESQISIYMKKFFQDMV